jgi:ankyrin repeat protein
LLLATGADPRIESVTEGTPLHLAAMRGHADLVARLLEHGADVNAQLNIGSGNCPLHAAAGEGQVAAAEVLIEAGADLDCINQWTDTPLSTAASSGREAVVALLLAKGADVNHATSQGLTALHYAVARGYIDLVRRLLEAGADVAVSSVHEGQRGTPFEVARHVGNEEIVALLIARGVTE